MVLAGLFLPFAATAPAQALIPPRFPEGWQMVQAGVANEPDQRGTKVVRIEGGTKSGASSLTLQIARPPGDRKLELTMWLRGTEDNQWVSIDTFATKTENGKPRPAPIRVNPGEGYVTTEYARLTKGWTRFTKSVTVSRSSESLTIAVKNPWAQPLFVSSPKLTPKGAELCDLDGPGVLATRIDVWVKPAKGHEEGKVTFPIPIRYRDQAPLAMRLTSNRKGAIRSHRFYRRPDGLNWLCEVRVRPDAKPTQIGWEGLVYSRAPQIAVLPKASQPVVPPEAAPWLKRTKCVQTDSPLIIARAQALAKDDPDVETYVRRVIRFTCDNRGGNQAWNRLDAEMSLLCAGGGTCTNRANLAAALLRLRGIPARTVAHLPTWAYGEALFTHWLVEYWHPGIGWTSAESTWGEFKPPAYTTAIVAISSPEDEEASFDPMQTRWVLPGAPMWAFVHLGEDIVPDPEQNQQRNWARPERRITGSPAALEALFIAAQSAYEPALASKKFSDPRYFDQVKAATKSGSAVTLAAALRK